MVETMLTKRLAFESFPELRYNAIASHLKYKG